MPRTLQRQNLDSGYSDFGAQVDILDDVEELDAFLHGALEGLAAGDEAGTASALVDDGGGNGFFEVIGPEAPPLLMRPARPCSSWRPDSESGRWGDR